MTEPLDETDDAITTELDDYGKRIALELYEAREAKAEAEDRIEKARDAVMQWLYVRNAQVGTVAGTKVVSVRTTAKPYFMMAKFKAEHADLHRTYVEMRDSVTVLVHSTHGLHGADA